MITDILSWLLVPLGILRWQVSGLRRFLFVHMGVSGLLSLTYASGGHWSGACVALGAGTAAGLQAVIGRKVSLGVRLAIAAPAIGLAVALREPGLIALLPILAFSIARVGEALQRDRLLRLILIGSSLLWFGYAFNTGLSGVIVFEILGLGSQLVAFWRLYRPGVARDPVSGLRIEKIKP